MLSYQFLQPCELNAHLTTLQNRYTVLKMQTRIMQTRIFSISESTLRGIRKRRIGQKKVKLAALIQTQNSGFLTFCLQPDDLSPMPRHTVFFEKMRHSKSCCCTRRSYECSKDRRVNWCRRHLFFDFTNSIFSND